MLLAENQEGYKNLLKLVTISHLEGFYYRPRLDKKLLSTYSKGLIALSGCLKGEVACRILEDNLTQAQKTALEYAAIFGEDNFYLELQDHSLAEQKKINFWLKNLSKKLSIPLVATNDVLPKPEDARIHDILLSVQTLSVMGKLFPAKQEHYFKGKRR